MQANPFAKQSAELSVEENRKNRAPSFSEDEPTHPRKASLTKQDHEDLRAEKPGKDKRLDFENPEQKRSSFPKNGNREERTIAEDQKKNRSPKKTASPFDNDEDDERGKEEDTIIRRRRKARERERSSDGGEGLKSPKLERRVSHEGTNC